MAGMTKEERFLLYQIKAIRRFQRLRQPKTREEAQRLALEWIHRFARSARVRWDNRWRPRGAGTLFERKVGGTWKT